MTSTIENAVGEPAANEKPRLKEAVPLTAERLRELLHYEPETGSFTWKARTPEDFEDGKKQSKEHNCAIWNGRYAGKPAGTVNKVIGYSTICVEHSYIYAHRLAWLYVHGSWPVDQIDHINSLRHDNRLSNLREADRGQQEMNKPVSARNTSGFKGVSWTPREQKWRANIAADGKPLSLGYWDDPLKAWVAYSIAAMKLHGNFARFV